MENLTTRKAAIKKALAAEAAKEHLDELGEGGRDQTMMIRFWKEYRPRLFSLLEEMGITATFARICEERAQEEGSDNHHRRGMGPWDGQEQAQRNWYLMDEEEELDEPHEVLECVLKRASRMGYRQRFNPLTDGTSA